LIGPDVFLHLQGFDLVLRSFVLHAPALAKLPHFLAVQFCLDQGFMEFAYSRIAFLDLILKTGVV